MPTVIDKALLACVATQLMTRNEVVVNGKTTPVRRTSRNNLRTASFQIAGRGYEAIEQNPGKPSRWGDLARRRHDVVQFKNVDTNRFVAVAVDGKVTVYGQQKTP